MLPESAQESLVLVQLSDLHLSADPAAEYRGQFPDANLAALAPAVQALEPDLIVLSGDISEDASPSSYWRAGSFVRNLAPRVGWIPGNHDQRKIMAGIFDELGLESGPVLKAGGWQILLLDSADPADRPEGIVDADRLAPIGLLRSDQPALAFIHHQPLPVGAPWIDKYALLEPERLWAELAHSPVRALAFGHVHQVFRGEKNGIACLSAPSVAASSMAASEEFTPADFGPAARWFHLWPDGRWDSGILQA